MFLMQMFSPCSRSFLAATMLYLATLTVAAHAQSSDLAPLSFTNPLSLARGSLTSDSVNSFHVSDADACMIAKEDWGWAGCDGMDALTFFLVPGADAILFETPNSDGYVTTEDWQSSDKEEAIASIETELAAGLRAQGEQLGIPIVFDGWLVYPTLDPEKHVLYYATKSTWNGETNINVKASFFDRKGYVAFTIVTISTNPTEAEIRAMVNATIAHYQPQEGQDYASYVAGDAVSATGALGVLAALVGVKFGKAAFGGLLAAAALFLKKGGFLLLALPFAWVKKRFSRSRKATDSEPRDPTS
jgi:hypothetical protein